MGQETLQVQDDTTAYADDVNSLTQKTNAAFDGVATELDSVGGLAGLARKWANDPQGIKPEPTVDEYSSKAYAQEAAAWAAAAPGVGIRLADGTIAPEESAKTLAQSVVQHVDDAATSAAEALVSEVAAAASEAAALASEGNAHDSEIAAGTSELNAGTSELNSLASELKAHQWAEEAEDVQVDPGEFSAHHWALKAAHIAGNVVNYSQPNGSVITTKGTTAQRDALPVSGYLRFNTDEKSFEGFDGNEWAGIGGGGLAWETSDSGVVLAEDGKGYLLDCSAAARTVNLPPGVVGMQIGVGDWKGNCSTNSITIVQNPSENIMGLGEHLILEVDNQSVILTYADATRGWVIVGGAW